MMNLEVAVERVDATTTVITLTGRMTLGMRLREVESKINHIAEDGTQKLVLDLAGVEYVDSAGLGLLMLLYGKGGSTATDQCRMPPSLPRQSEEPCAHWPYTAHWMTV